MSTLITIHEHDRLGYYTGNTVDIEDCHPIPRFWTPIALPTIPTGKFARLNGSAWVIEDTKQSIKHVPQEVTNFQGKIALMVFGYYDAVVQMIEQSGDPAYQIAWNAAHFQRYSEIIRTLAALLQVDEDLMDDMFIYAGKVV